MTLKTSIKISEEGLSFLKRFRSNRRKVETDDRDLAYWELIEVIARYFKNQNERYHELVRVLPKEEKNV